MTFQVDVDSWWIGLNRRRGGVRTHRRRPGSFRPQQHRGAVERCIDRDIAHVPESNVPTASCRVQAAGVHAFVLVWRIISVADSSTDAAPFRITM